MNIQQFWSDVLAQRADEIREFKLKDDKIVAMDEYWADDGEAPKWRQDMKIGSKIR